MAVDEKLRAFPVPEQVQKQWETDMIINSRGVQCDSELVNGALRCSAEITERLMNEAVALTGLDNPNSVAKLKVWLEIELDEELDTLRKSDVTELLGKEIESASVGQEIRGNGAVHLSGRQNQRAAAILRCQSHRTMGGASGAGAEPAADARRAA